MTSPANIDDVLTPPSTDPGHGWGQSLSNGALGPALLHLVTARAGLGPPDPAHAWLRAATRAPVSSHSDGGLFCGATALAYVLHIASPTHPLLDALDEHIDTLARQRLDAAHARIDQGELTETAEFDLIKGLTGIGTYLLTRTPDSRRTADVLTYLVRLTQPVRHRGEELPGWWANNAPISPGDFSGGHANLGLAHGISGPLALLSVAMIRGITVEGQGTAIARICSSMDHWHTTDTDSAAGWPRWITRTQHRDGTGAEANPMPLAWCYGTPGQARAQQLAAKALGDDERHVVAVRALAACTSHAGIARLDGSLCHGRAGLLQTLRRADATDPTHTLTPYIEKLEKQTRDAACTGVGFLEGAAGNALALLPGTAQRIGWDACLLTTV